ncbi:MAG: spore coat U domain-containing protein [Rickettsiella sp.]|nr:spore coat U domain-containing protein [Rickettsiella sp.]
MFSLLYKSSILFVCLVFLGFINLAFAAILSTNMLVSVRVMPSCSITTTPLVFGLYTPYASISTKSNAWLRILCTLNTPYNIALDQGMGNSATTRLRVMSGPGRETIQYTLSQNPTHTINWGNTVGIDTALENGTGIPQYLIVYGEIPAKQNVSIGAYKDVVNVSIIF